MNKAAELGFVDVARQALNRRVSQTENICNQIKRNDHGNRFMLVAQVVIQGAFAFIMLWWAINVGRFFTVLSNPETTHLEFWVCAIFLLFALHRSGKIAQSFERIRHFTERDYKYIRGYVFQLAFLIGLLWVIVNTWQALIWLFDRIPTMHDSMPDPLFSYRVSRYGEQAISVMMLFARAALLATVAKHIGLIIKDSINLRKMLELDDNVRGVQSIQRSLQKCISDINSVADKADAVVLGSTNKSLKSQYNFDADIKMYTRIAEQYQNPDDTVAYTMLTLSHAALIYFFGSALLLFINPPLEGFIIERMGIGAAVIVTVIICFMTCIFYVRSQVKTVQKYASSIQTIKLRETIYKMRKWITVLLIVAIMLSFAHHTGWFGGNNPWERIQLAEVDFGALEVNMSASSENMPSAVPGASISEFDIYRTSSAHWNLRSTPDAGGDANIITSLEPHTEVAVLDSWDGEWYKIASVNEYEPKIGYVVTRALERTDNLISPNELFPQYNVAHIEEGIYEGCWENNLPNGHGALTFLNGDVYTGDFEDGKMHGKGRLVTSNGSIYIGNWTNGLFVD